MSRKEIPLAACPHNYMVDCPIRPRKCEKCGWFPAEDRRRRNRLQRDYELNRNKEEEK